MLQEDTEGDETEYEYDEQEDFMFALLDAGEEPIEVTKSFQALSEPESVADLEEIEDQDDTLAFMNAFAHRVQLGKKQSKKSRKPKEDIDALIKMFDCNSKGQNKNCDVAEEQVIVKNIKDLESLEVKKLVRPIPRDPHEIDRLASLCPKPQEVQLLPGKAWRLFDTGARCNAMKLSRLPSI